MTTRDTVLVCGAGIDTLAFLRSGAVADERVGALAGRGLVKVVVAVDDPTSMAPEVSSELAALGASVVAADAVDPEVLARVGYVVRSPGFGILHPLLSAPALAAVDITTPIGVWMRSFADRVPTLGVTGTKGKSTAVALGERYLLAEGARPVVIGNIGVPVWDRLAPGVIDGLEERTVVVLEVSSYMAADLGVPPDVGVLTSLDEDHVSWHGGTSAYHRDKLSFFAAGTEPGSRPSPPVFVPVPEALAVETLTGLGLDVRPVDVASERFAAARLALASDGHPAHVASNLAVVASAAASLLDAELSSDSLGAAATGFGALPSRHRFVGRLGGVRFIDDALASNPMGCAAALDALDPGPVALIVGGTARDVSYRPLVSSALRRGARIVVIELPDNGPDIGQALVDGGAAVARVRAETVADAVARASEALGSGVGTVIFAPAAPTPARLGNYVDRSRDFIAAVAALGATMAPDGTTSA